MSESRKEIIRIALVGPANAGKSSLSYRLKEKKFKEEKTTVGFDFCNFPFSDKKLEIWDFAGQERHQEGGGVLLMGRPFSAVVRVVDVSRDSEESQSIEQLIAKHKRATSELKQNCQYFLVGAKRDARTSDQGVTDEALKEIAIRHQLIALGVCSAKTGEYFPFGAEAKEAKEAKEANTTELLLTHICSNLEPVPSTSRQTSLLLSVDTASGANVAEPFSAHPEYATFFPKEEEKQDGKLSVTTQTGSCFSPFTFFTATVTGVAVGGLLPPVMSLSPHYMMLAGGVTFTAAYVLLFLLYSIFQCCYPEGLGGNFRCPC